MYGYTLLNNTGRLADVFFAKSSVVQSILWLFTNWVSGWVYWYKAICHSGQLKILLDLTHKHLEMPGCIFSTVATDTLVLKHHMLSVSMVLTKYSSIGTFSYKNVIVMRNEIRKKNYNPEKYPVLGIEAWNAAVSCEILTAIIIMCWNTLGPFY